MDQARGMANVLFKNRGAHPVRVAQSCSGLMLSVLLLGCPGPPAPTPADPPVAAPLFEVCPAPYFDAALELTQGRPEAALARLPPAEACSRGGLVRGLVLLLAGRGAEADQVLEPLAVRPRSDPAVNRLAAELLAFGALERGAGGRVAVGRWVEAAVAGGRSRRGVLLRVLLLGESDPAGAGAEVLTLARPVPVVGDPQDLILRELAAWLVELLADGQPLPATAEPRAHAVLARLLNELANRRLGLAYRQYKEWARREAGASHPDLATAVAADVELEAECSWDLLDFPAMLALTERFLAAQPRAFGVRHQQLRALHRLGRYAQIVALEPTFTLTECPRCGLAVAAAHHRLGDGLEQPLLRQLRAAHPEQPEVALALGLSLLQTTGANGGQAAERVALEESWRLLSQAAQALPDDLTAARGLASALTRLGRTEEGRQAALRYGELARRFEREVRHPRELLSNAASRYAEALGALEQRESARAEELARFIEGDVPHFALLPLLRLALIRPGDPREPLLVRAFGEALHQQNPGLLAGEGGP